MHGTTSADGSDIQAAEAKHSELQLQQRTSTFKTRPSQAMSDS
jgi:hypothetical protein